MKTLQDYLDEEVRDLKVMLFVLPVVLVVFLYVAIGAALVVTQRGFSPCAPHASTIHNPDWLGVNLIADYVLPIFVWGPRFVEHVVQDDMPLRHFVFASDCQWSDQGPGRQRLFDRPGGPGSCPAGTVAFRGDRCAIPVGDWEPVMRFGPAGSTWRCPHGWVTQSRHDPFAACRLPALRQPAGAACPKGFVAWTPKPDTEHVRTSVANYLAYPKGVEVCRRDDVED